MICTARGTIRVYVAEEQEFYRGIYQASFESDPTFSFLGSSNGDIESLKRHLSNEKPDVLLIGAKKLDAGVVQQIEQLYTECPETRPVILLTTLGQEESKSLRKLIQKCRRGIGVYLKQSIDNGRQLHEIIRSVSRGQVILDPAVASSILIERTDYPFMKLLTERELEILNLLALGHTNQGIAKALFIDVKTVAHHLNNIYGKLKEDSELDEMHPRVSVARLYLETTGELMPFNSKNAVSVFPSA